MRICGIAGDVAAHAVREVPGRPLVRPLAWPRQAVRSGSTSPRPPSRVPASSPVASAGPDPFSLADPPTVTGILETAGFADVTFADVHEPVYFGPDVAPAPPSVGDYASTNTVL